MFTPLKTSETLLSGAVILGFALLLMRASNTWFYPEWPASIIPSLINRSPVGIGNKKLFVQRRPLVIANGLSGR